MSINAPENFAFIDTLGAFLIVNSSNFIDQTLFSKLILTLPPKNHSQRSAGRVDKIAKGVKPPIPRH